MIPRQPLDSAPRKRRGVEKGGGLASTRIMKRMEERVRIRILIQVFILAILGTTVGAGYDVPKPDRDPRPSTEEQARLITEGVALHEQGKFDEAIRLYRLVLEENPDNVDALWEWSLSLSAQGDHVGSLGVCRRGARYRSPALGGFYGMMANCLDDLGRQKDALKVYEAGLKILPVDQDRQRAMLCFNMAVTLVRLDKPEKARDSLKRAVVLNPSHPGSHLLLARLYQSGGYRIPALLAAARFLSLEPATQRSGQARQIFLAMLQQGVSSGEDGSKINILVNDKAKKDEGDFTVLEVGLQMAMALQFSSEVEKAGKSQVRKVVDCFDRFLAMLAGGRLDKEPGFVSLYYVPYFSELQKQGFAEAFTYSIFSGAGNEEVDAWLRDNAAKAGGLEAWSKSYRWPDLKE